jgi:hypothetical protein
MRLIAIRAGSDQSQPVQQRRAASTDSMATDARLKSVTPRSDIIEMIRPKAVNAQPVPMRKVDQRLRKQHRAKPDAQIEPGHGGARFRDCFRMIGQGLQPEDLRSDSCGANSTEGQIRWSPAPKTRPATRPVSSANRTRSCLSPRSASRPLRACPRFSTRLAAPKPRPAGTPPLGQLPAASLRSVACDLAFPVHDVDAAHADDRCAPRMVQPSGTSPKTMKAERRHPQQLAVDERRNLRRAGQPAGLDQQRMPAHAEHAEAGEQHPFEYRGPGICP